MSNLFINDLFWTLQGEGTHWGRRALFVRMPYCNLSCSWCDTSFNSYKKWTIDEFKEFAQREPGRFAVVTGGEPMMHRHTPVVVEELRKLEFKIAAETNGTMPPPCDFDWITCSPKRDAEYFVHPSLDYAVNEFKYVVDQDFDFAVLDRHDVNDHRHYSLSPEFSSFNANVAKIIEYIRQHPKWRLSLQTHKWIGVQ